MSSIQNRAIIPYQSNTGSDGKIMSIHIFGMLFPDATKTTDSNET